MAVAFYSIFDYLRESTVGFLEIIRRSANIENGDIILPKVVCIGTQSSGKSSLLSRIVKRNIFPAVYRNYINYLSDYNRNNFNLQAKTLCTKCPIVLKLYNSTTVRCSVIWDGHTRDFENDGSVLEWITTIFNGLIICNISN